MERENKLALLVGMDPELCSSVEELLSSLGLQCNRVAHEQDVRQMVLSQQYAMVVIGVGQQVPAGLDCCRRLREAGLTQPMLLISRDEDETAAIIGLELGADDYLRHPLNQLELQARVRALLRRQRLLDSACSEAVIAPRKLCTAGITVDIDKRSAYLDSKRVHLSPTEFDFLRLFVAHPGQVFSRERLVEEIWDGGPSAYEQNVRSHISNLRAKLRAAGAAREYIINERGFGYRFVDELELVEPPDFSSGIRKTIADAAHGE